MFSCEVPKKGSVTSIQTCFSAMCSKINCLLVGTHRAGCRARWRQRWSRCSAGGSSGYPTRRHSHGQRLGFRADAPADFTVVGQKFRPPTVCANRKQAKGFTDDSLQCQTQLAGQKRGAYLLNHALNQGLGNRPPSVGGENWAPTKKSVGF